MNPSLPVRMTDDLHPLLDEWRIEPPNRSEFVREVWRRIRSRQSEPSLRLRNAIESALSRPAWAIVIVGAFFCFGVSVGTMCNWRAARGAHAKGKAAYILAVDPILHQGGDLR